MSPPNCVRVVHVKNRIDTLRSEVAPRVEPAGVRGPLRPSEPSDHLDSITRSEVDQMPRRGELNRSGDSPHREWRLVREGCRLDHNPRPVLERPCRTAPGLPPALDPRRRGHRPRETDKHRVASQDATHGVRTPVAPSRPVTCCSNDDKHEQQRRRASSASEADRNKTRGTQSRPCSEDRHTREPVELIDGNSESKGYRDRRAGTPATLHFVRRRRFAFHDSRGAGQTKGAMDDNDRPGALSLDRAPGGRRSIDPCGPPGR